MPSAWSVRSGALADCVERVSPAFRGLSRERCIGRFAIPIRRSARMAVAIASPFLVYRDGGGREHVVPLEADHPRLTIGRGATTDVWLDWDGEAWRLHAALERFGADWTVIDDGLSRNGTYVNGERVSGRRRLDDGDVVRCGRTELLFQSPPATAVHGATIEEGQAPAVLRAALEAAPDQAVVSVLARTPP